MSSTLESDGVFHSLRYLCKGDKHRVRKLIVDVATADEKIYKAKEKLLVERHKFRRTLVQLNQHIVLLEKEKIDLQRKLNLCDHTKPSPVALLGNDPAENDDRLTHHQHSWTLLPLSVPISYPFKPPTLGNSRETVEESKRQNQPRINKPLLQDVSTVPKQKTPPVDTNTDVNKFGFPTHSTTVSPSNNTMVVPLNSQWTDFDSPETLLTPYSNCINDSSVLDLATSLNCDSTHEPLVSQIATNQCDTTNSCDTERDMNILEDLFFRGFT